jgi:hypothetical protein
MKTYILVSNERTVLTGPFRELCILAMRAVEEDPTRVFKVFKARAGEKRATVVAEVSADGGRLVHSGIRESVAGLLKLR